MYQLLLLIPHGGKPYMVYSHDWPDNYVEERGVYVGEIWATELSKDLKPKTNNNSLLNKLTILFFKILKAFSLI